MLKTITMYNVSIIIPIYNVSKYIYKSLQSALDQSYRSIEYILVNDCATDDSMNVVHSLIDHHHRKDAIKIITHEKNKGLSAARNTGIVNSSGKYLFFMDSDDYIVSQCIEVHVKQLEASGADFSTASFDTQNIKSPHTKSIKSLRILKGNEIADSLFKRDWNISACNKLIKKDFFISNELYFKDGLLHEDLLWTLDLCFASKTAIIIPDKLYIYVIRVNSITTSRTSIKRVNDLISINHLICEKVLSKNINQSKFLFGFLSFLKFNCALLILNSDESNIVKKDLYCRNRELDKRIRTRISKYSLFLYLPFWIFKPVMKTPYFIYKYLQKK